MCNSLFFISYSIPFKFLSSLPNQRYSNPMFMLINPLRLSPEFLISSSLSATRNNILSTDRVPLKSPVPNFTALCAVQSLLPLLHSLPRPAKFEPRYTRSYKIYQLANQYFYCRFLEIQFHFQSFNWMGGSQRGSRGD